MVRILILLAIALALTSGASTALAQDEGRWEAPGGFFSLDFRPWGWTELSPGGEPGDVLGIEHQAFQQGGAMRTCFVTERRRDFPRRLTQQSLNEMSANMSGRFEGVGPPRALSRIDVDGVLVTEAIYDQPIYMHMRWFYVADGASVIQFHMNCGASDEVPDEVSANIASMLQTLRIRNSDQ
jgi:hypothetical protein